MDAALSPYLMPFAGLVLGLVVGVVVQRSDWCSMGAVADIVLIGDWRRMRSWLLAMAVAIAATQALLAAGVLDGVRAAYAVPASGWFGVAAGGLAFGFGMTRTGGCISKNLVRLGGGSLRSLVVLVIVALAGLATFVGPLGWLAEAGGGGPALPERPVPDAPAPASRALAGGLVALALAWFCLKDRRFRASRPLLVAGIVLGLLVPLAWLAADLVAGGTGVLLPRALNFIDASLDTLVLIGTGKALPFGATLLGGTVLGALAGAAWSGRLRFEGFAGLDDLKSNLGGALLMGVGGVLAGGCTIGQGLSGISTLAPAAVLAAGSIVLGALAGIRTLEFGGVRGALRALAGS